ncbi:tyrosine-type recombinase/integrase [Nonomuraea sp. NPDC050556]|uniref:tyrosine-type recombinase/integrase n=1 Tax=Nonomuraea sp. NPDC050556 TaxID=3364369 RepID=UPI00379B2572
MTGSEPADERVALIPTAVLPPGPAHRRAPGSQAGAATPTSTPATASGGAGAGLVLGGPGGLGGQDPPPPRPLVDSVGDIAVLRPRRRYRDGGEVPGAHVDLIDALPRTDDDPEVGQRASWPTVAAWLRAGKTAATRRGRLADLVMFVRWLAATAPGAGLWQVDEDVVVAYLDELGTGSERAAQLTRGGRVLGAATLARHLSTLKSLYGYAVRRRVITYSPAQFVEPPEVGKAGTTPALNLGEAAALLRGAQAIAPRYPVDAATVVLLATVGLRAGELESLTVGRIRRSAGHWVMSFRLKGGKTILVPLAAEAMNLLRPLLADRTAGELVLLREDGRSFD